MRLLLKTLKVTAFSIAAMMITSCGDKVKVEAPPPPEVMVSKPLYKMITDYMIFSGQTAEFQSVEIRARVEGWLEKTHFAAGDPVKEGDLLFEIDPKAYQAEVDQTQAELEAKKADLNLALTNLKRSEQLLEKDSISRLQYDQMKAESLVKKAQAQIAEANLQKARLNLSYTNIKAPISGLTTRPYIDDGNLVGASETTLLTEIVNNEKIYFYFDLSERDYLELRRMFPDARPEKGRQRIKVHAQLADEKGFPHLGRIDFSEPKLDPSTGTLTARAIFDNKDRIMVAGMFGRIRIPIRRREAALVPEIAIGTSQAGRYLLVVGEKNIVEQRLVDLGAQKGTLRVIEKGVNRDDLIVVNAIQRARPGAPVNPQMTRIKDETVAEPEGKQEKEHERERGQKESDAPAQNQPAKKEAE